MTLMRKLFTTLSLAAVPATAAAQMQPYYPGIYSDTVRRGVFFELFGAGELYSLSYEQRIRPNTLLQVGFTRWTIAFREPRHIKRAGILGLARTYPLGAFFPEDVLIEIGGAVVAGRHTTERDSYVALDSLGNFERTVTTRRAPWVTLNGLVGLRAQPLHGGLTFRLGATPEVTLRDVPGVGGRVLPQIGMSVGFTW